MDTRIRHVICAFIILVCAGCAEIFNPNTNETGVMEDNGMVNGKHMRITSQGGIHIENIFETEGDLESQMNAKSKGNTTKNNTGVTAE